MSAARLIAAEHAPSRQRLNAAPAAPVLDARIDALASVLDEMEPARAADLILAIERRDPVVGAPLRETFLAFAGWANEEATERGV